MLALKLADLFVRLQRNRKDLEAEGAGASTPLDVRRTTLMLRQTSSPSAIEDVKPNHSWIFLKIRNLLTAMKRMLTINSFYGIPQFPIALQHLQSILAFEESSDKRKRQSRFHGPKLLGPIVQYWPETQEIEERTDNQGDEQEIFQVIPFGDSRPATPLAILPKNLSLRYQNYPLFPVPGSFDVIVNREEKKNEELLVELKDTQQRLKEAEERLSAMQNDIFEVCKQNEILRASLKQYEDREEDLKGNMIHMQKSLNDVVDVLTKRRSEFRHPETNEKNRNGIEAKRALEATSSFPALEDVQGKDESEKTTSDYLHQKVESLKHFHEGTNSNQLEKRHATLGEEKLVRTASHSCRDETQEAEDKELFNLYVSKDDRELLENKLEELRLRLAEDESLKMNITELENRVKDLTNNLKRKDVELKEMRSACIKETERLRTSLSRTEDDLHRARKNYSIIKQEKQELEKLSNMDTINVAENVGDNLQNEVLSLHTNMQEEIERRRLVEKALARARKEIQKQREQCQHLNRVLHDIEEIVITRDYNDKWAMEHIIQIIKRGTGETKANPDENNGRDPNSEPSETFTSVHQLQGSDVQSDKVIEYNRETIEQQKDMESASNGDDLWVATAETGMPAIATKNFCCPRRNPQSLAKRRPLTLNRTCSNQVPSRNRSIRTDSTVMYQLAFYNDVKDASENGEIATLSDRHLREKDISETSMENLYCASSVGRKSGELSPCSVRSKEDHSKNETVRCDSSDVKTDKTISYSLSEEDLLSESEKHYASSLNRVCKGKPNLMYDIVDWEPEREATPEEVKNSSFAEVHQKSNAHLQKIHTIRNNRKQIISEGVGKYTRNKIVRKIASFKRIQQDGEVQNLDKVSSLSKTCSTVADNQFSSEGIKSSEESAHYMPERDSDSRSITSRDRQPIKRSNGDLSSRTGKYNLEELAKLFLDDENEKSQKLQDPGKVRLPERRQSRAFRDSKITLRASEKLDSSGDDRSTTAERRSRGLDTMSEEVDTGVLNVANRKTYSSSRDASLKMFGTRRRTASIDYPSRSSAAYRKGTHKFRDWEQAPKSADGKFRFDEATDIDVLYRRDQRSPREEGRSVSHPKDGPASPKKKTQARVRAKMENHDGYLDSEIYRSSNLDGTQSSNSFGRECQTLAQ